MGDTNVPLGTRGATTSVTANHVALQSEDYYLVKPTFVLSFNLGERFTNAWTALQQCYCEIIQTLWTRKKSLL